MNTLAIKTEHVTLAQALKMAGIAATGGHAKILVREREVTVNGEVIEQPGRKLFPEDCFSVGEDEWQIVTDK